MGEFLFQNNPLPDGENEHSYLLRLTYQGLLQRYNGASKEEAEKLDPDEIIPKLSDEVRERAKMELGVMGNMGYEGYFLIVQDFINWGKSQGIVLGLGAVARLVRLLRMH